MADWADEAARHAAEHYFGCGGEAGGIEKLAEDLRAARAEGIEAAAKVAERTPACPFDGPTTLEPEDPCPVCGDLGTDIDAPSHCRSAAVAIRSLLTKKPGDAAP